MIASGLSSAADAGFSAPLEAVPPALQDGVVAIGNFDGVHRGHQAVLTRARDIARAGARPVVALTFEPHPRSVFRPDQPIFRLTPPALKARVLQAVGIDGLVTATFDRPFASLTAQEFVDEVVIGRLRARHLLVGYNFHFGKARAGNPAFLAEAGARAGFEVTVAEPLTDEAGGQISSTRIRDALSAGDVAGANGLLGWRWRVDAVVRHGDKRGRELGYPTANMRLPDDCALAYGIYAVRVTLDGRRIDGVASFGRRPTFDNGAPLLEVFLFDFSGDLYGRTLGVTFHDYLRPELRFTSIEGLIDQMGRDCERALAVLKSAGPLSPTDAALDGLG